MIAERSSLEFESYVRGFHVYKDKWTPKIGEVFTAIHEKNNLYDKFAIAVLREEAMHPLNLHV